MFPHLSPEPQIMRTGSWSDYSLLDSGKGRKYERYGRYTVVRPEPQCLWRPTFTEAVWGAADASFEPGDDDDLGRWRFARELPDTWPMQWRNVVFNGRFTPFRHLAFFPEQAANWEWISQRLATAPAPMKVLNLFGYTGVASLVAATCGASVTHVDASKKAVTWARQNGQLSGLEKKPIRWICEDARRWVNREIKRGATYDAIILDPPKYGRGPDGDVWRLYEDLPDLIAGCASLLSGDAAFLLVNGYSERLTGLALACLVRDRLEGRSGSIDWGELALMEQGGERGVGLSFFARWNAPLGSVL